MSAFTKDEDDFLRENYLKIPATRMSKMLGRSKSAARQRMAVLGLVVPPETLERFRKESEFKPGHDSWNKGLKGLCIGGKETQFKKGGLPPNTLYDGAITIRKDKRGVGYKHIRIGQAKWKMLHVKNWEDAHGPVPKGKVVVFRNGDTMNCDLDNLMLLTMKENMLRNSLHNYPKEIVSAVQLIGAVKRKVNRKIKMLQNEK